MKPILSPYHLITFGRFLILCLLTCFLFSSPIDLSAQCGDRAAYIRTDTEEEPWSDQTGNPMSNIDAMDAAFGAGQWDALFFETMDLSVLSDDTYGVIFIEGSENGAEEFAAFLAANMALLEAYVNAGGSLFLNAAPNEGGDINLGFGGISLDASNFTECAIIGEPTSPVFSSIPGITHFEGDDFGHAVVCPPHMSPSVLIEDENDGDDVLVEIDYGAGKVIFGGMTIPYFHCAGVGSCPVTAECDDVESNALRSGILTYLASANVENCAAEPIPTMGEWGLIVLGIALLIFSVVGLRSRVAVGLD